MRYAAMAFGLIALCGVFLSAGCGGNEERTAASPAPPPADPEPTPKRVWEDFEERLALVFSDPIPRGEHSHDSGEAFQIYATPWAGEALKAVAARSRSAPAEFRSGSLLVQKHDDGGVYVMHKRPAGRLPDTRDWYFAVAREGRIVMETGGLRGDRVKETCGDCHSVLGAATDWVVPPGRQAHPSNRD